jgi:hypothetical protein
MPSDERPLRTMLSPWQEPTHDAGGRGNRARNDP